MALPAQSYVWFRLRHVVALWIQRETGLAPAAVLYDEQNQPRPPLPYVGLLRRDFPFEAFDEEWIREVPVASTLTVTASTPGETASFLLFGLRYAYTLQAGDDAATARDALLALVDDDRCRVDPGTQFAIGFQPCTATGAGASSIDFAGLGVGAVRVEAVEGCTAVDVEELRSVQQGLRRMLVRLNLYWPTRQLGFDTIDEYAEALRSSLVNEDTALWLAARGVGVDNPARVSIQEASAVSGGASQRRKFVDVVFNAKSKLYRPGVALAGVDAPAIEIVA